MAVPLAIGALARSAGSAIASASPETRQKVINYLNKATGGKVNSVSDAIDFASKSSGGLTVVAMNAARAGLNPDSMFTEDVLGQLQRQEADALLANLRSVYTEGIGQLDAASQFKRQGGFADEIFEISMIKLWESRLGIRSPEAAIEFHTAMRVVAGMSSERFRELQTLRSM